MKKQVLIIGGGASGMTAAIAAAKEGAEVTILEHMDRVGKKILSTGNGRCNLTNLDMREDCYRSDQKAFPMQVISRFPVKDTLSFFEQMGILTKSRNGYIYPNSDQASSVLDALRLELERLGVYVAAGCKVHSVKKNGKGRFLIRTDQGDFSGHALILATGSKAAPVTGSDGSGYELAKSFGHRIIPPLPALVQLRCDGKYFKQLSGIRCEANLTLLIGQNPVVSEKGELQLTDYGISGIPTFQISRFASKGLAKGKKVSVLIDFLPTLSAEETRNFLFKRARTLSNRTCSDFLTGVFHKKLSGVLLKQAGIALETKVSQVSSENWERLIHLIKWFEVHVTATNSCEQAQVCCGGVDTREINADSMESKLVPGLYLVGELVDVDGICGGYNLQWAWSSGSLAGMYSAR